MVQSRDFHVELRTSPPGTLPGPPLRLAIAGAGALGSEICRQLLLCGYPHVLVIDPDVLEPRNLPLSRLFRDAVALNQAALGEPKAHIIARLAQAAGLPWTARQDEIADIGLAELRPTSIIISATDSTLARAETAYAARTLRLPMIDAAIHADGTAGGRIAWFPPSLAAACTLCGLTRRRRAELLSFAASASLGCAAPPDLPAMSGPATFACRVASAVLAWLEHLPTSPDAFACRLGTADSQPSTISLPLNPDCPWHDLPDPELLHPLTSDQTPAELLAHAGPDAVLDLPWPLCLRARCRHCGHEASPHRRTAYVRRRLRCTHCSAVGVLEPEEQVASIRSNQIAARQTIQQLGLPGMHLYQVRDAFFSGARREPAR